MDRPQIYDQAQGRDYDVLRGWREALYGLGQLALDLLGSNGTVVAGFAATPTGPTSLNVNLAAGDIYQSAQVDATTYGSLAADTTLTLQQGFAAAQLLAFSTSGLAAGQSRWALVQATFTQTDDIPGDDPNGGLLNYINASNPTGPAWSGPGNDGATQNTRRKSVATISIIYGTVATTGSEVPPNPSANNVGLYLIDLAFGQTAITSGNILVAGPSVGTGVPSNYPQAPFLTGLLNSHHSGGAGQAPKIKLGSEVQGSLPSGQIIATIGTVAVVNGGTPVVIYSGINALIRVVFDDNSGNTYSALVGHYQFSNTYTPGCTTSEGTPGSVAFASDGSGHLTMSRTGGPSTVNVEVQLIAAG